MYNRFLCIVVICISVCYIQKLKISNDEEIFKVKTDLKSQIERERETKELYKNLSTEMNIDTIRDCVFEIHHWLNDYILKNQKKNDK